MSGSIAHYNLLERVGEGGLGDVYRARDTKVGRTVALKVQREAVPATPRSERLIDDARAAAAISHPNIATLFDVGLHEGRLYLAYEYVPGTTLRQQMEGRPMNARHALDLAVQVADALEHAHSHGVVHKDLRPDTIVETAKGSAKVLDFGMSAWTRGGQTRALAAAAPASVAADAVTVLSYASPEQALGGRVDLRTDLFSLGTIVYEMLTGANPFAGADAATTLINITQRVPPAPSAIVPDLPKILDMVLARALAKDLSRRTESAAKLSNELRRCIDNLDPRSTSPAMRPEAPPVAATRGELLPLEEDSSGSGVWWVVAALGGALAATVYYWLK
jgi:eukaryotic-like serine/threonine-protein kinase